MIRRSVPVALSLALAACTPSPRHPERAKPAPRFDIGVFLGDSEGEATLRVVHKPPVAVSVRSSGRMDGDTLVLDQEVQEGTKPAEHRQWRLREQSQGHYIGTLSDAAGPVAGEVSGNRLTLHYRLKGAFSATQWLYLQPGRHTILNGLAVSLWGIRVASLEERIMLDLPPPADPPRAPKPR